MSLTLTRDDVEKRVVDWVARLEELYANVLDWRENLPPELKGQVLRLELPQRPEALLAKYSVNPGMVPSIAIINSKGRFAFVPSAIWIVGANGRVNLNTPNGMFILADMGGYSDLPSRWVLIGSELKAEFDEFDQETFTRLLAAQHRVPHQKMLESIHAAYVDASGAIADKLESEPENVNWQAASRFTDYAFYVLVFAQLEQFILAVYLGREGNGIYRANQPPFMHCVNTVFSRFSQKAQNLSEYYKLRCDIAHGELVDGKSVNVSNYAQEFLRFMTEPADPDEDAFYKKAFEDF